MGHLSTAISPWLPWSPSPLRHSRVSFAVRRRGIFTESLHAAVCRGATRRMSLHARHYHARKDRGLPTPRVAAGSCAALGRGPEATRAPLMIEPKWRKTMYARHECEFVGSYLDRSLTDIPGELRELAWECRLIDAIWHCHINCYDPMTSVNKEARFARTRSWQEQQESSISWQQQQPGRGQGRGDAKNGRRLR